MVSAVCPIRQRRRVEKEPEDWAAVQERYRYYFTEPRPELERAVRRLWLPRFAHPPHAVYPCLLASEDCDMDA